MFSGCSHYKTYLCSLLCPSSLPSSIPAFPFPLPRGTRRCCCYCWDSKELGGLPCGAILYVASSCLPNPSPSLSSRLTMPIPPTFAVCPFLWSCNFLLGFLFMLIIVIAFTRSAARVAAGAAAATQHYTFPSKQTRANTHTLTHTHWHRERGALVQLALLN